MPKLSFKDVTAKITKQNRARDESVPLVSSSQSLNNGMYTQGSSRDGRKISNSSTSIPRSASNSSNLSDAPMMKIRAGMLPPSTPPSPSAEVDIDFDLVPFKFYTRIGDHWKSAFCQSLAIVLVCLLCPSIIILLIAICATKYPSSERRKMGHKELRKIYAMYLLLCILTFTKDLIVVAIVLQLHFKTDASNYIVAYSPIVYCWFLILFIFPIALFYFTDVKYEFSFDKNKKTLLQTYANFFTSSSAKRQQTQKLVEQDKFFQEKYYFLSNLQSVEKEFMFVWRAMSKHLLYAATGLALVVSLVHALFPLFIQLISLNTDNVKSQALNHTATNHTSENFTSQSNTTQSNSKTNVVIGLSTFNSFIASLLASPYFFYVLLWNLRMLNQWKSFNTNENDPTATLVNGGPQGIAMWWKIRQTLRFFSSSWNCLSVFLGKMLCVICMVFLAVLSITIILKTYSLDSDYKISNLVPILVDNILLYMVLLTLGIFALLINKEMKLSSSMILSKQLNVSYELSRLMNLEQESIEQEPGVKIKVRVMRGCLMLLQEMTSSMAHLEDNTSSGMILSCTVVSTIMVVGSTFIGGSYLLYHL